VSAPIEIPTVPCACCDGSGMVTLPLHLFRVLLEMRHLGSARASDVIKALATLEPVTPTAMANRLASLERLGFLTSDKDGRRRMYRVVEAEGETGGTA